MKTAITILFFTLLTQLSFGQNKSFVKRLTDKIAWDDFLVITVDHYSERYVRKEINIIFHQDSILKIHSVLKSNYPVDRQIDTVFTLSGQQFNLLNNFENNFNNNIPTGLVIAGTYSTYKITINGETSKSVNKSDYSLILDLLKE